MSLPTSLPIPVFYSLCTQPVNNTPIICGNENDDDRKSCFNFEDVLFGEISESTTKSHSNAISTHFNDSILLISVHSIEILSGQRWNSLPLIPVSEDMVNFASAITMVNQIIVFGGSFANSSPSSSVFRYRFHLRKWEEMQNLSKPRSNHCSILVQSNVILHISTFPDSIEKWIYDNSSETFLIENFDSKLFQEQSAENSRPIIIPFIDQSNLWSQWSNWSKTVTEGTLSRNRCRKQSDCESQNKNIKESNSLLIIGFDYRLVPDHGQIDIGPHVMHVQTPLATMKTEEIGYFRLPIETPFSWDSGYYAGAAILHDIVFMMGSRNNLHLQDIFVIRNCGFELFYHNGKQIKFPETAKEGYILEG